MVSPELEVKVAVAAALRRAVARSMFSVALSASFGDILDSFVSSSLSYCIKRMKYYDMDEFEPKEPRETDFIFNVRQQLSEALRLYALTFAFWTLSESYIVSILILYVVYLLNLQGNLRNLVAIKQERGPQVWNAGLS